MKSPTSLLAVLLIGGSMLAAEPVPVAITVSDTVVRANVPRIGINIRAWPDVETDTMVCNALNNNPGLENLDLRTMLVVRSVDAQGIVTEGELNDGDRARLSDEVWKGATYRVLSGAAAGRTGTVTNHAWDGHRHRFTLDGNGSAPAKGDLLWIGKPNVPTSEKCETGVRGPWLGGETVTDDVSPMNGGARCLRMKRPGNDVLMAWYPRLMDTYRHASISTRWQGDRTHVFSVWAKGAKGLKLRVQMGYGDGEDSQGQHKDFTMNGSWMLCTLVVQPNLGKGEGSNGEYQVRNIQLRLKSAGEVLIDQAVFYEDEAPPLRVLPRIRQELLAARPGTIRLWTGAAGMSLDNLLAGPYQRQQVLGWTGTHVVSAPSQIWMDEGLRLCAEVGAQPWLIVNASLTPEEWAGLVEYLAGPADSPYGKRRAIDGQVKPWTSVFERIYLEFGHDTWAKDERLNWGEHLTSAPWNFADGSVHAKLVQAAFAKVKASPHYAANAAKLRLVADAHWRKPEWNAQLGTTGADVFAYVPAIHSRGREQLKETKEGTTGVAALLPQLLSYPWRVNRPGHEAMVKLAAGKGIAIAEAGGRGGEADVANALRSVSGAAAAMDDCLMALGQGAESVNLFNLHQGGQSSAIHSDGYDMRRQPVFQALVAVNQAIAGDRVTATVASMPTMTHGSAQIPALACYPFQSAQGRQLVLINRDPAQAYLVKLSLPGGAKVGKALVLAHPEPDASNHITEKVSTVEQTVDLAKGFEVPARALIVIREVK